MGRISFRKTYWVPTACEVRGLYLIVVVSVYKRLSAGLVRQVLSLAFLNISIEVTNFKSEAIRLLVNVLSPPDPQCQDTSRCSEHKFPIFQHIGAIDMLQMYTPTWWFTTLLWFTTMCSSKKSLSWGSRAGGRRDAEITTTARINK
jgi:hypothetical protein